MGTPNFIPGQGRLATSASDFESHINGTADRHTADEIDLTIPLVINGQSYYTVSSALSAIDLTSSTGTFITLPDGYDCYAASDISPLFGPPNSNFPYDSTIPSIDGIVNDILSNPNNPLHHRLRDGGILYIPEGTYTIKNTINVPSGITVLGTNYGTKLINQTVSASNLYGLPLFSIQADTRVSDLGVISGGSINKPFMFAKDNAFINITIADNFAEPKFVGDTSYYNPQNTATSALVNAATNASPIQITTSGPHGFATGNTILTIGIGGNTSANGSFVITVINANNFTLNGSTGNGSYTSGGFAYGVPSPLIVQNEGSSLICDNVKFIGKVIYSGSQPSNTTGSAIGTNSNVLAPNGTALSVRNCIFDGFSLPISFTTSAGIRDRLYCINNKVRSFGSISVVPSGITPGTGNGFGALFSAAPVRTNLCSMNISNNYLYTNYIDNTLSVNVSMVLVQQSPLPLTSLVSTTSGNAVSPIVITTVSPNNYKTGQTVSVSGVGGNTAANVINTIITVIDSTHFSLNGTTGNGSYTSGGIITVATPVNINISGNEITALSSTQSSVALNQRITTYYGSITEPSFTLYGVANSSIYGNVNLSSKNVCAPLSLNIVNIGLSSNYTIVGDEAVIVVPSTGGNSTINIPSTVTSAGQIFIIKNMAIGTVNIILHRLDNSDKIDGLFSDYIIASSFQTIRLVSDGSHNWLLV